MFLRGLGPEPLLTQIGAASAEFIPRRKATLLYLVAIGGNTGSGNNPAIGLIGSAGMSNALPGSVTINDLTTVAAQSGGQAAQLPAPPIP